MDILEEILAQMDSALRPEFDKAIDNTIERAFKEDVKTLGFMVANSIKCQWEVMKPHLFYAYCLGVKAQEAKAQAVPEGFVLIKASDRDQEMLELIDQRDHMESQAEELKDKLQALYGVDFGEHSSCNFPFQNAIDYDDSDLVLVPKEPTEAMYIAGIDKRQSGGNTADVYKAMIEAQEQK